MWAPSNLVRDFLCFACVYLISEGQLTFVYQGLNDLPCLRIALVGAESKPLNLTGSVLKFEVGEDASFWRAYSFSENYVELLRQYLTHFLVGLCCSISVLWMALPWF